MLSRTAILRAGQPAWLVQQNRAQQPTRPAFSSRRAMHHRMQVSSAGSGGAEANSSSASIEESVDTVSAWLARHAQDPEELRRQAPTWEALEWALGGRQEAVALVRREPRLLSLSPSTIADNVRLMNRDLRLSPEDIQASITKCPQLFLNAYTSQEMQAKFRYFPEVLRRPMRTILVKQPHLLLWSFDSMVCKVSFMQHKGDSHFRRTLAWINMSNDDFCWHFSYDPEEYRSWEAHQLSAPRWEAL